MDALYLTARIELHEGQLGGGSWTTRRVEETSASGGQQLDNDGPNHVDNMSVH